MSSTAFECPGCHATCRVSRDDHGVISYVQITHEGDACIWATKHFERWVNETLAAALGVNVQRGGGSS